MSKPVKLTLTKYMSIICFLTYFGRYDAISRCVLRPKRALHNYAHKVRQQICFECLNSFTLFTKQSASNLANCDHKLHFRKFVFTKGVMEEGGRDEELCQYEILNLKTFLNQKSFVVAVFAAARFSYKRRGMQKGYLLTPFHSIRCCCCCTLRN